MKFACWWSRSVSTRNRDEGTRSSAQHPWTRSCKTSFHRRDECSTRRGSADAVTHPLTPANGGASEHDCGTQTPCQPVSLGHNPPVDRRSAAGGMANR